MNNRFNRSARLILIGLLLAGLAAIPILPAVALGPAEPVRGLAGGGGPPGAAGPAQVTVQQLQDVYSPAVEPARIPLPDRPVPSFVYPTAVLWDNGPLVTHPGAGYNGADASAVQASLGMSTNGFGCQYGQGLYLADDFTVTDPGGWHVEAVTFFAYQVDAPIDPSTITAVHYAIWDGPPGGMDSAVVWGDMATNELISSTWSNIYRASDTALLTNNRPIMANRASAGFTLPQGSYWIEWAMEGSLASGPWTPPVTVLGQTTTGNAMQFSSIWYTILDDGTSTPQDLPFIIEGAVLEEPVGVVYLPIVLKNFSLIPGTPVLNAIENADGDGNYTVSWSSTGAITYTLEEDDNTDFSSPTTAYSGSNASTAIGGRDLGTYYYRVKASSAYGSSDWSNVESAVVTVLPPPCPQAGPWTGTTSQGHEISFTVENTPVCQIAAESLAITIRDSCGFVTRTIFHGSFPITDNQFSTGGTVLAVTGDFTSTSTASGTFEMDMSNPVPPPTACKASGTWTATP